MRESADSSTRHQCYHVLSDATLSTGGSRSFVHMKVMGYLAFAVRENRLRWRALPQLVQRKHPQDAYPVDSTNKERIVDGWRPGTARPLPRSPLPSGGSVCPQRPDQHTASHRMFYDAACEVHHEHFSRTADRRVKRPKSDLELLDRFCLDGSVSAWVGNGLMTG